MCVINVAQKSIVNLCVILFIVPIAYVRNIMYYITIAKNKTKKPTGAATNSHRSAPIKRKVAPL